MFAVFKRNRPVVIFFSLILLVVALSLTSIYFYKKYNRLTLNSAATSQADAEKLVTEVSRVAVLPDGETPTIATVSDPDALKDQSFFVGAKKGDKVLIYTTAKKAFLYDPIDRKIINIAPINTGSDVSPAAGTTTTPPSGTKKP